MTVNLFRGSSPLESQVLLLRNRAVSQQSQVPHPHQVKLSPGKDSPSLGSLSTMLRSEFSEDSNQHKKSNI